MTTSVAAHSGRVMFRPQHTCFTVADLDRSIAFYEGVLGFRRLAQREVGGAHCATLTGLADARLRLVFLQMGGHLLELIQYLAPVGSRAPTRTCDVGNAHVCFEIDDMQVAYEYLRERGVEFVSTPLKIHGGPNDGGYVVYFRDPDGITLELMQRPAGAAPLA